MEFKVTAKDVVSTSVSIGLDLIIKKEDKECEVELSITYEDMPNFGTTDITWEVVSSSDDSFLDEDGVEDQLDDFIQEYILENIGKI
jgi:hypothetical protein